MYIQVLYASLSHDGEGCAPPPELGGTVDDGTDKGSVVHEGEIAVAVASAECK